MVDAVQLWVVALGVVCVFLALIVFYAARKVLVLKEDIEKAKARLLAVENLQKGADEMLKTSLVPEVEKLRNDQRESISRLSADIRDLNGSQLTIHTKVNEHDLRLKSISTTVNQLSVQQQQQQHEAAMSAMLGGGNGGGGGNGSTKAASRGDTKSAAGGGGGQQQQSLKNTINNASKSNNAVVSPLLQQRSQSSFSAFSPAADEDKDNSFSATALLASLILNNTNNKSAGVSNSSESVFGLLGEALTPEAFPQQDAGGNIVVSSATDDSGSGGGGGSGAALLSRLLVPHQPSVGVGSTFGFSSPAAKSTRNSKGPHHIGSSSGKFHAVPPRTSTIRSILESHGRLPPSSLSPSSPSSSLHVSSSLSPSSPKKRLSSAAAFAASLQPVTAVPSAAVVYHQVSGASVVHDSSQQQQLALLDDKRQSPAAAGALRRYPSSSYSSSLRRAVYRKKIMRLEFSVGPSMDETAISLSVAGGEGGGGQLGTSSGTITNNIIINGKGRHSLTPAENMLSVPLLELGGDVGPSSSGNTTGSSGNGSGDRSPAALFFLADVIQLSIGYEPLPVDESESVCFTLILKGSERSTRGLALSAGTTTAALPTVAAGTNSLGTRQGASLNQLSFSRQQPQNQPVEIVLYAPLSAAVEEWVVFLHSHLGDKVHIRDDLL